MTSDRDGPTVLVDERRIVDDPCETGTEGFTMTTTLHVRIEPAEEADDRIRRKLERIDSGDPGAIGDDSVLSVRDEQALERVLTGANLELVRAAATHEPGSLRELARLLDRDIKNVSRASNRLAELGIVELVSDGRAKRPVVPYDEIEVVYPLRSEAADTPASVDEM